MKRKTATIILAAALACLPLSAACGNTSQNNASQTETDKTDNAVNADSASRPSGGYSSAAPLFEPTVVYAQNNIRMSLDSYSESGIFPGFDVTIENGTDTPLQLATDLISANGTMIAAGPGKAVNVAAHDVLVDTIYIDTGALDIAGIATEDICDLLMEIEFYRPETTDTVYQPVRVEIPMREQPQSRAAREQEESEEPLVYEDNDIAITAAGEMELFQTGENATCLRITNKRTTNLSFKISDITINGKPVESDPSYSMGFGWSREEEYVTVFPENNLIVAIPSEPDTDEENTKKSISFTWTPVSGVGQTRQITIEE